MTTLPMLFQKSSTCKINYLMGSLWSLLKCSANSVRYYASHYNHSILSITMGRI